MLSLALSWNDTVLLYQQHGRKTRNHMCVIVTHHDSTGTSVCENAMSLPSVVTAVSNLPARLQFHAYFSLLSWIEKIDVWKCVFLCCLMEYSSVFHISSMDV